MRYCPVCKIEYSDKAEFCKKCEAKLMEKQEQKEVVKPDYKRLVKMILYTFGFIVFIMILYYIYSMLLAKA